MEEEVKTIRTIKEFIAWYEAKENMNTEQSLQGDLELHKFYIKFKYILQQEDEETDRLAKFLG